MADYTIVNLTTAVVGIATTIANKIQATNSNDFTTTNGTITLGNYTIEKSSTYPVSPPRRPQTGQLFPRGVYNK